MSTQESMRDPFADQIASITMETLSPIVANALDVGSATVSSYEMRRISRGSTAAGVWRVTGKAQVRGQDKPWSMVLKMLRRQAPDYDGFFQPVDDPTSVTYWRREFELYQSGLVADLSVPLRTPRCYMAEERDGRLWCWEEDLGDVEAARWSDEQFALAARHLGMFNGLWLTQREMPDLPWLCKGLVRWRLSRRTHSEETFRDAVAKLNQQVPVGDVWTDDVAEASQLLEDCPAFVDALEELPKTFMHQDAGRKSLVQRMGDSGQPETVALDWGFCGIGEVGGEIATLVASSSRWFGLEPERLQAVEEQVLESYLDGLRVMGWRDDPEQVRLAYLLTSAVMFRPAVMSKVWEDPERFRAGLQAIFGRSLEDVIRRWGQVNHFVVQKAQQAREILGMGRAREAGA